MIPDEFIELYYGKHETLDLHGMTKEDAKGALIFALNNLKYDTKCLDSYSWLSWWNSDKKTRS